MVKFKSENGQMLLIVVLTMIIALTVGLSVASRTITNLRISRQSEESQRAFQAAEAGVEQTIQAGGSSAPINLNNRSNFSTSVSYPSGASFLLNNGELLDQDVGLDVWLSDYSTTPGLSFQNPISGTVSVFWGTNNQTNCTNPGGTNGPSTVESAIEIIVLSGNKLLPTVNKYVVEAGGCNRIVGATSPLGGGNPGGTTLTFSNSFNVPVINGLIMRVVPIFNSSKMAISSTTNMPKQGTVVESLGKSGDTVRRVQYFASYPQVPVEIFPYSLISQ